MGLRFGNGKRKIESGAAADLAFGPGAATMPVNDAPDIGQADPGAFEFSRAVQALENAKELFVDRNGSPEILALDGPILCPPFCSSGGGGLGKTTLVVRDDKSMEVI